MANRCLASAVACMIAFRRDLEKTMQEELTPDEIAIIQLIGGYQDRQLTRAGITAKELEEQIRKTIEEPGPLFDSLREKQLISLHEGSDSPSEYAECRFRLTDRGKVRYDLMPLPGNLAATRGTQQGSTFTVFGRQIQFRDNGVWCNDEYIDIRKDDSVAVFRVLCEQPDVPVCFEKLLPNQQQCPTQAEQPLKDAVSHLRKQIRPLGLDIENRRTIGYRLVQRDDRGN